MVTKFRNLVFEGGGVKGIAYAGVIEALHKKNILSDIKRVAGTSAGAITALLLALGYNPEEIKLKLLECDFSKFISSNREPLCFQAIKLLRSKSFGINDNCKLKNWLIKSIGEKVNINDVRNINFRDFHEQITIKNNHPHLYVIGTNLSQQKYEIYSYFTTQNMKVVDAVCISASIPIFFECLPSKDKDIRVDGGLLWNYPVRIFDDKEYLINYENGEIKDNWGDKEEYVFNHETLGFVLKPERSNYIEQPKIKIKNLLDYLKALTSLLVSSSNKVHFEDEDWNRTVFVDTLNVSPTDFNIDENIKKQLIDEGEYGVNNHLNWRTKHPQDVNYLPK